ncbi:unnamed protein product [Phytomonas sp. Hart1]|nr:unnamed protein product [Phytomonas sp. Hart1]|eukprot:CCW68644.1 unnamed protein product [Phytomonas sp. isolate Hart1]
MVFSIPSYICTGDRPKKVVDFRAHSLALLVGHPKTGHNPDALFEKEFKYIWNGERGGYLEKIRRQQAMVESKKNLTSNGFLYASPTRRPEGLGSYFGCFQKTPHPHIPEHLTSRGPPAVRKAPLPRGIFTSPSPKGSYGTPGLSLSAIGNDYIASFYDQPSVNEKLYREAWRRRMPAETFRPCGRRGFTFDESLLTGASKCYIMTVPFREKRSPPKFAHFVIQQPWRPPGYVEDKPTTLEYWEDPLNGYDPRIDPKERIKKPSSAVFYPSSNSGSFWYTQSIVFKCL